jgi:uncharacterized surface protein with fasciclin (FAS1) repeats
MHLMQHFSDDVHMLKLISLSPFRCRRAVSQVTVVVLTGLTLVACSSAGSQRDTSSTVAVATPTDTTIPAPPSESDVFTTIEATGKFPTFVKLVEQAGLAETLQTGGPFTIAIPSEAAFAALPAADLSALNNDAVELARVLKYHVVPAIVAPDPAASGPVPTLEGSTLDVQFTDTNTTINGAQALTSPRATANGAYIEIDTVLLPPAA